MKRKPISLSPAKTPTLRHNVADTLTEAILSGRIRPGERLNESQLSRDLEVSRAPIREALHQLEEQGLVVNSPRRGMFVVDLGEEEVSQTVSVRVLLESEALRLSRENIPRSGFTRLGQILARLDGSGQMPALQQVRLDHEFHSAVWSYCGNPCLERTLNGLVTPLFAHAVIRIGGGARKVFMMPHQPIVDYLRGESAQGAADVISAHLGHDPKAELSESPLHAESA